MKIIRVSFPVIVAIGLLFACNKDPEDQPQHEIRIYNISQQTDWEYWVECTSGESMFLRKGDTLDEVLYLPGPEKTGYIISPKSVFDNLYLEIGLDDAIALVEESRFTGIDRLVFMDADRITWVMRDIPTETQVGSIILSESMTMLERVSRAGGMIHNVGCALENTLDRITSINAPDILGCNSHLASLSIKKLAAMTPLELTDLTDSTTINSINCPGKQYETCLRDLALSSYEFVGSLPDPGEDETWTTLLLLSKEQQSGDEHLDALLKLCYEYMHELVKQDWLMDGFLCGEYDNIPSEWAEIANNSTGNTISTQNEQVALLWDAAYNLIFNANNIITEIGINTGNKYEDSVLGEAKGLRAYAYNVLASKYGGVPLIQDDTKHSQVARSTYEEIMEFIKTESKEASLFLGADPDVLDSWFTKSGALALETRAHMNTGDWEAAIESTDHLMNIGYFTNDTTDRYSNVNHPGTIMGFENQPNSTFSILFEKGPVMPVFHYTEILMSKAECLYRMGNTEEARTYYLEATMDYQDGITMDIIFDFWLTEMNREGISLSVLKRFERAQDSLQVQPFQLVLPIPHHMLNVNPNLSQNDGY